MAMHAARAWGDDDAADADKCDVMDYDAAPTFMTRSPASGFRPARVHSSADQYRTTKTTESCKAFMTADAKQNRANTAPHAAETRAAPGWTKTGAGSVPGAAWKPAAVPLSMPYPPVYLSPDLSPQPALGERLLRVARALEPLGMVVELGWDGFPTLRPAAPGIHEHGTRPCCAHAWVKATHFYHQHARIWSGGAPI